MHQLPQQQRRRRQSDQLSDKAGDGADPALQEQDGKSTQPRKRARVACHHCHARKVRCDVSYVGFPCTNCRFDSYECVVRQSTARRPRRRIDLLPAAAVIATAPRLIALEEDASSRKANALSSGSGTEQASQSQSPSTTLSRTESHEAAAAQAASRPGKDNEEDNTNNNDIVVDDDDDDNEEENDDDLDFLSSLQPVTAPMEDPTLSTELEFAFPTSAAYSYHLFLKLSDTTKLLPEDTQYLEMKGCLHVPSGPNLDHFIREYFLHVHPCMPIMNEGEFWDMYLHKQTQGGEQTDDQHSTIPLLVFQAMLFASATFVPLKVLKACGFKSFHDAKEILHRRARLLYTSQTERNPFSLAQASLLLSFQYTAQDRQVNTSWLSLAIQYAREENCHLYYCLPDITPSQRRAKKRLWWSCILRDRVVALGVRRHIQITPDHFDFTQECITDADFVDELATSQVYDFDIKSRLVGTFIAQCKLAMALTPAIMTIYPLDGIVTPDLSDPVEISKLQIKMDNSKAALTKWLAEANVQLTASTDDAVTLYADLTYIYYSTAEIALCHYVLYILHHQTTMSSDVPERLHTTQAILQTALLNVTDRITSLVRMGQVGFLPISIIAYMALPIVLLSVDVKLSLSESQRAKRKHQLNIYVETMRYCRDRYEFTGIVSGFIAKLLEVIDAGKIGKPTPELPNSTSRSLLHDSNSINRPSNWLDIITLKPQLYFRVSSSLDYALSHGRFPSERELATWNLGSKPPQEPSNLLQGTTQATNQATLMNMEGFGLTDMDDIQRVLGTEISYEPQLFDVGDVFMLSDMGASPPNYDVFDVVDAASAAKVNFDVMDTNAIPDGGADGSDQLSRILLHTSDQESPGDLLL